MCACVHMYVCVYEGRKHGSGGIELKSSHLCGKYFISPAIRTSTALMQPSVVIFSSVTNVKLRQTIPCFKVFYSCVCSWGHVYMGVVCVWWSCTHVKSENNSLGLVFSLKL